VQALPAGVVRRGWALGCWVLGGWVGGWVGRHAAVAVAVAQLFPIVCFVAEGSRQY
jgi:hypothetical protein